MVQKIFILILLLHIIFSRQVNTPEIPQMSTQNSSQQHSSSYKIMSRLKQFLQLIHPDQMNKAPIQIKKENIVSLNNLKEYLHAINKKKSIQRKLLRFYIPQKTNHKTKKFYSFNLELPEIQRSKMNKQKFQKLLNKIVSALKTKLNQAQQSQSIKLKHKEMNPQSEQLKAQIQKQKDLIKQLQKQLRQKNKIFLSMDDSKDQKKLPEKIQMMRRLLKLRLEEPDGKFNKVQYHPIFYPVTRQEYKKIINDHYKIPSEYVEKCLKKTAILISKDLKREVYFLVDFKDEDIEKVIFDISVHDELNYKYGWQDEMFYQRKKRRREILYNVGL